jgi:hypothetical protein
MTKVCAGMVTVVAGGQFGGVAELIGGQAQVWSFNSSIPRQLGQIPSPQGGVKLVCIR